jgi:hypothetical protein
LPTFEIILQLLRMFVKCLCHNFKNKKRRKKTLFSADLKVIEFLIFIRCGAPPQGLDAPLFLQGLSPTKRLSLCLIKALLPLKR